MVASASVRKRAPFGIRTIDPSGMNVAGVPVSVCEPDVFVAARRVTPVMPARLSNARQVVERLSRRLVGVEGVVHLL